MGCFQSIQQPLGSLSGGNWNEKFLNFVLVLHRQFPVQNTLISMGVPHKYVILNTCHFCSAGFITQPQNGHCLPAKYHVLLTLCSLTTSVIT